MVSEIFVGQEGYQNRLVRGFYESQGWWRWTAKSFAVTLDSPLSAQPVALDMDFNLPDELAASGANAVIRARVNGYEIAKVKYQIPGRYRLVQPVPPKALATRPALIEFETDRTVPGPSGREQGVIVVSIALRGDASIPVPADEALRQARGGYEFLLAQRKSMLPPAKQHELLKLFHDLPVWRHMWFQNVQIEKNPLDLWMMQQVIYETRPDFVVETGTWRGGSALYWAYTLNGLGLTQSHVFTVDVQNLTQTASQHELWKKHVTFLKGSSTDAAIVSQIAERVRGKRVLVVLDSDHSAKHVLNELRVYAPLVSRGGYLVVEDTHLDAIPSAPDFGPGPAAALQQFLSEGGSRDFVRDEAREAFLMTFNPGGWIRRR